MINGLSFFDLLYSMFPNICSILKYCNKHKIADKLQLKHCLRFMLLQTSIFRGMLHVQSAMSKSESTRVCLLQLERDMSVQQA